MSEEFLDQFVIGTLLGDSYITKDGRYGFAHTVKQKDYFEHKVEILNKFGLGPRVREYQTKGNTFKQWEIKPADCLVARVTVANRWKSLRSLWYPAGKKIVPADIKLGAVALTYWYMDDGSANKRIKFTDNRVGRTTQYFDKPRVNQFRLHLDGFDNQSQELLQDKLKELGIDGWFYTKKDSGNRNLVITQDESKRKFKEIVFPLMKDIPSMHYKIDLETSFAIKQASKVCELRGTETTQPPINGVTSL